jgi:hypothetical protein
LLHGLELADRPLESDSLISVSNAKRQDRFQCAGGLHAADDRPHKHQGRAVKARRRACVTQGLHAIENYDIRRIAGRRMSFIDLAIFRGDHYNGGVGCVFGYDSNVRCIGRERNAERPAAQRATFA